MGDTGRGRVNSTCTGRKLLSVRMFWGTFRMAGGAVWVKIHFNVFVSLSAPHSCHLQRGVSWSCQTGKAGERDRGRTDGSWDSDMGWNAGWYQEHQKRLQSSVRGSEEKEHTLAARHLKKSRMSLDPAGVIWLRTHSLAKATHNDSRSPQDNCELTRNECSTLYSIKASYTASFREKYDMIWCCTEALLAILCTWQMDKILRQACYVTQAASKHSVCPNVSCLPIQPLL